MYLTCYVFLSKPWLVNIIRNDICINMYIICVCLVCVCVFCGVMICIYITCVCCVRVRLCVLWCHMSYHILREDLSKFFISHPEISFNAIRTDLQLQQVPTHRSLISANERRDGQTDQVMSGNAWNYMNINYGLFNSLAPGRYGQSVNCKLIIQGLYSLRRRRLTGIGIPMINLRRSDDRLRFIMGIPILIRWRLLSE